MVWVVVSCGVCLVGVLFSVAVVAADCCLSLSVGFCLGS